MNDNVPKEVLEIVDGLNSIQREVFTTFDRDEKKRLARDFSRHITMLKELGYTAKFTKTSGKMEYIWYPISFDEYKNGTFSRNTECEFEYTNMRPDRKTLKGDCTTRTMAFLFFGTMTYDEIENEQYRLAKACHTRRNVRSTYGLILQNKGYRSICLKIKVKRSVLGNILRETITRPIATFSRGHVAVVDVGGIVRDTWDSRGGQVNEIYAPLEEIYAIVNRLEEFGIPCSVSYPKTILPLKETA